MQTNQQAPSVRRELPFLLSKKRHGEREGNRASLVVKTVLDNRVYINCVEQPGVREGAVIWANWANGTDGVPQFQVADDGAYDAIASIVYHIPASYDRERTDLALARGWLAWMLQTSWTFSKHTDDDELLAYQEQVDRVLGVLEHVRDPHKVQARLQTVRARSGEDARGQVNWPSRSMIIWSADKQLADRVKLSHVIEGKLDPRKRALIMLLSDVWELKNGVLRVLQSELVALRSDRDLSARQLMRAADRLERCARQLSGVSVAPWGRRAFKHSAAEISESVEALRAGNRVGAIDPLDTSVRSLGTVQDVRRTLEETRTVVSLLDKSGRVPEAHDIDRLDQSLLGIDEEFSIPGLDDGFRRPIVEPVRALIADARRAATDGDYRSREVYDLIKEAANML